MIAAEQYLKTRGAAKALGVSSSTVKRWVDSGMIRAVRTVGKHRLIPMSEALRVAREQGARDDKIETLVGVRPSGRMEIDGQIRDLLFERLRDGKAREADTLIQSVYSTGCGAAVLADQLIRPVMERVGHDWMVGLLDVFQEHEATQIVTASLRDLSRRATHESENRKPVALGANTEGDPYALANLLAELLLTEMGWEVRNLGVNLPLQSLARATRLHKPELIFLSVGYLKDPESFVREYLSFYKVAAANGAAVIVGGQALSPELRSRLVYASFGDRMAHLAEFARLIWNDAKSRATEKTHTTDDQHTL